MYFIGVDIFGRNLQVEKNENFQRIIEVYVKFSNFITNDYM